MKANLGIILTPNTVYHGKSFPMNTVILRMETGTEMYCSDFRSDNPVIYVYSISEKKWYAIKGKNNFYFEMHKYHNAHVKKKWKYLNVRVMMKHDRKKKSGSGGARREFVGAITDYECSKNPLHDFRRVYV